MLYGYLSKLDIPVELYAPYGTPQKELEVVFLSGERLSDVTSDTSLDPRIARRVAASLVKHQEALEYLKDN